MKIGIDARMYGPIAKGLGRYTKEVVDRVVEMDQINEYVVFLRPENESEFIVSEKNKKRVKKKIVNVNWYSLKEQIVMPWYYKKEKLDLVHIPHFNVPILIKNKFVVTIHDLILTKFPSLRATTLSPLKYKIKNLGYRWVIKTALKKAKKIITVSNFTKEDIVTQFGTPREKIIVTYEGVAELKKSTDKEYINKQGKSNYQAILESDERFIMYVGNAYPHKNLNGLLRIFNILKNNKKDLKLVLVGKKDYFHVQVEEYAKKIGLLDDENRVVFAGHVPDNDLLIMYKKASAYVFPSKYEGFGLPPIEAMQAGCPVISSDRSAMPEILGEAAIFFDPEDEVGASKKIEQLIDNEDLRKRLIEKGYKKAREYSWNDCAKETLGVYRQAIGNR